MADTTQPDLTGLRIREAVRAIVLTPGSDVLLVRFEFPGGTRWALPGGGIEPGESDHDALCRELVEELGLRDVTIGPHVWSRLHVVRFESGLWDGQRERIHLVEVPGRFEPTPALTWDELRLEYVYELRWWTVDEITAAQSAPDVDPRLFAPGGLGRRLRDLVEHGPPPTPVDVEI
jgi:8-oxo-dGTP diphosphatase